MISQKTIQEVNDTARVDEVIGDFVNLKKKGSNLLALCPFHDEKTPSFTVTPSKNMYYCFGCGRGGGPVQFVMEHEKYAFPEAIRFLAEKYQIHIEETQRDDRDEEEIRKQESLHIVNQFAARFYQKQLLESEVGTRIGLSYFKERGYLESTIRKFELGFAPEGGIELSQEARNAGYQLSIMRDLGLVNKSDKDFFRNRVIFPIHNLSGKVIAFAGRTLSSGKREPKYINSPETEIYVKSKSLYGLHFARQAIRKKGECILVEGYTDVLSLFQSGIENVVASSGTALTRDQIKLIKRYAESITILYDSDPAGVNAAVRGLDLILEENLTVKIVLLPDGEDPDSLIRKLGVDEFRSFLSTAAKDFILFKAGLLHKEAQSDPIKRTLMIRDIVSSLARIPDAIKRAMYIQECSTFLDVDEATLVRETNVGIREINRKNRLSKSSYERRANRDIEKTIHDQTPHEDPHQKLIIDKTSDEAQERDIIRILLNDGDKLYNEEMKLTVGGYIIENLNDVIDQFEIPVYQKFIHLYKNLLDSGQTPTTSFFINETEDDIRKLAVRILGAKDDYSPNWMKMKSLPLLTQKEPDQNYINDSYQSILRLKLRKILKKIQENQKKMRLISSSEDENDKKELNFLIKLHYTLINTRNQITSEFKNVVLGV